ncbi:alpha-D-ribose 1-methylphosphonate 5-triphosphate diphosphatase [Lentibacter algarum]|uniref:alpha-D-ribose 1-methylphosphonate 5-triphosphate diphosphatase n=1 Tax=Lentibacter algarum TaxID=576131 RepID=UPI001C07CFF5|nr:alpha-D-ribose 1-methylphosphonate 5-triphosphate diphosphatase [Lentibacter algarum]MBU2980935.1 alpha-D-ribose 1-methylphosphonate 5-triphosphate diphosphatase [Lentibacter algarum]
MTELALRLTGADVLRADGVNQEPLAFSDGVICERAERDVNLEGYLVLPGLVDIHGDGFERHVAVRRGAMKDMSDGLRAAEAELAANGITTATMAQFFSWEGGLRGAEFADKFLGTLRLVQEQVITDLQAQLRFETHMLDDYDEFEKLVEKHAVKYVVFNDHIQHERLEKGLVPRRLNGMALKSRRSPETLHKQLQKMHDDRAKVPAAVTALAERLAAKNVRLGSHDDRTREDRVFWANAGVALAEFPETMEAGEAAGESGAGVILGAPNVVRGGSHNGNVSAVDLIAMGHCHALASDYHYPSMRRAAFFVEAAGLLDLAGAWALVSSGPARLLGLTDRGTLETGKRADMMIVDAGTKRLAATIAGGRISHMSGDIAARFIQSGN